MRLRTMIVFGAGYAWGAWTGRDRFVELADRARSFLESDVVRDYLQRAQTDKAGRATDVAEEPEDVDELDEDEDIEDEDLEDEDLEDEEDVEDEDVEQAASDQEPQPARSGRPVRRRAPGRARR